MRHNLNSPIGIFDSGVGGLTVFQEIRRLLPGEDLLYFGDTARVPYGPRSREIIALFSLQLAKFLLTKQPKLLVVACNTISSTGEAINGIKNISPVPVIGVVRPTIEAAVNHSHSKRLALIGTEATIQGSLYKKTAVLIGGEVVYSQACPLFVPLVEEGLNDDKIIDLMIEYYLSDLKKRKNIDVLILGCTHYPPLRTKIKEFLGEKIKVIDSARPTAEFVGKFLLDKGLLNSKKKGRQEFFVTDSVEKFARSAFKIVNRSFKKESSFCPTQIFASECTKLNAFQLIIESAKLQLFMSKSGKKLRILRNVTFNSDFPLQAYLMLY